MRMGFAPAARDWAVLVAARELVPRMRWTWFLLSIAVRRDVWYVGFEEE